MKKEKTLFEPFAKKLIELVLDTSGQDLVYTELCSREPEVKKLGRVRFFAEYVPAKLALGCGFWKACCDAHQIENKDIQNVFFKEVMKRFESPDSLEVATRFSEDLYATNADSEGSPMLSVIEQMFNRLKLARIEGGSKAGAILPGFLFMVEVSEALKNVFENEFDDFIFAEDDFHVS